MKNQIFIFFMILALIPQTGLGKAFVTDSGAIRASTESSEEGTQRLTSELVGEFKLRALGPAMKPGRVADIAVNPRGRNVWYLAMASSGLWKTTNRGISWQPIFDEGGSYSLGCVTIDHSNPEVVWLGTGENISNRSVGYGDGVYKSTDGGRTWKQMGLRDSQHIGKILIDPRDPDVVYVAADSMFSTITQPCGTSTPRRWQARACYSRPARRVSTTNWIMLKRPSVISRRRIRPSVLS